MGEALGTDLSKIITVEDEGKTLFVRAGVGWRTPVVGKLRIRLQEDDADRYALAKGEPIVVPCVSEERRFKIADFLREEGVEAFVNVPIVGAEGKPSFGILEVDSRTPRHFHDDDISFLRTYANMMAAAMERLRTLRELRGLAEQRKCLLHELEHRLKNNLQSVSALIGVAARSTRNTDAKAVLRSVSERVDALRLVHEKIYGSGKFDRVDLASYLGELAATLLRSNRSEKLKIGLQSDLKPLIVSPDTAIGLGLITTEFITNSIKHAFDRDGTISIRLDQPDRGHARLVLSDTGRGLSQRNTAGTGMKLISGLAQQVAADIRWQSKPGTQLSLVFPAENL